MSRYRIHIGGESRLAELLVNGGELRCLLDDRPVTLTLIEARPPSYTVRTMEGQLLNCQITTVGNEMMVTWEGQCATGTITESFGGAGEEEDLTDGHAEVRAPMPGRVVALPAGVGSTVTKADPVVVIEAMKMQNALVAPLSGVIQTVHVKAGDTVEMGQLLITLSKGC
jgi:biotin carboxyl carrier protein